MTILIIILFIVAAICGYIYYREFCMMGQEVARHEEMRHTYTITTQNPIEEMLEEIETEQDVDEPGAVAKWNLLQPHF
jgi:cell division protein YceG involved in septum cleavage